MLRPIGEDVGEAHELDELEQRVRRVLQPDTTAMAPGGELRLATDDPSYLPWMVEHACRHAAFEWLAEGPADWRQRPADWPATRYERKEIAGKPIFLRLRRRQDLSV